MVVSTAFKDDHKPDLYHLMAAAKLIAPLLKRRFFILKSTSVIGVTKKIAQRTASYTI
ncbi:MAG: hypothetical protein ACEY3J_03785 [Arsenophonus sp.]